MREIKFRSWNTSTKSIEPRPYGGEYMSESTPLNGLIDSCQTECHQILMQYTGRKDKNNVEIYEGDIVRILYTDWISKPEDDPRTIDEYLNDIANIGSIEFNVSWCVNFGDEYYRGDIEPGTHGFIEVIGSINENPELVEEGTV